MENITWRNDMPNTRPAYDTQNVFAKILRGEIPARKVFEDDDILAFEDINAAAPIHVLVIPKGEFVSFDDFAQHASAEVLTHFWRTVQSIAKDIGAQNGGYRLITNHGAHANQSVPHFHVHIIGGKILGPLIVGDTHHA
jgi:histidine triad (HIT) family protein